MNTVLTTERLLVRRFATVDADALHAYRNDPQVARYQGWTMPYPLDAAQRLAAEMSRTELFRPGAWTQLAVERRAEPGLIGDVGVRREPIEPTAEIGLTFARSYWGHGYAAEAVTAVVDHVFAVVGVVRVVAFSHAANERAHRVLERAGLRATAADGDEILFLRRAESSPPGADL